MATRAMWKGVLRIGELRVPATLHAAVEDVAVHFHLLHDEDKVRVRQRMVNSVTGKERADGDIHKGYEVEPGAFVFLSEKELASLEPEASRDIEVHSFVPRAAIDNAWYDRPYYLAPAEKADAYFALAKALRDSSRAGVAHWVMRKRSYHGAVIVHDEHLVIVTLKTNDEVLRAPKVEPARRAADARELSMAEHLVSALSGHFDATDFKDEHRARVRALIEAKAHGKKLKPVKAPARRATKSLSSALEASLKHVEKERKSA
jgi:DNA end-binding protein Ku